MAWFTDVAAWVVPLLTDYVIPDDASVGTSIEFASLDGAVDAVNSSGVSFQADYPGIIPNYSVEPLVSPTSTGVQYTLKALKAVGFYGVVTTVLSYTPGKLNSWTFPLDRKNFGFCSLSRGLTVSYNKPIHYGRQYHIDGSVLSLLTSFRNSFDPSNRFNSAENIALDTFSAYLYPDVVLRVGFLPIWEVWAITFFRAAE